MHQFLLSVTPVVFFDLETSGLTKDAEVTWVAAIAYARGQIIDHLNMRVQFDKDKAAPEALEIQGYSYELWSDALPKSEAVESFARFLSKYKSVEHVSKRTGNPYKVAQLIGWNAVKFDGYFLKKMFDEAGVFLPADPRILDAMQFAQWLHQFKVIECADYKLETVAKAVGVSPWEVHKAYYDVLGLTHTVENMCIEMLMKRAEELAPGEK